MNIYIAGSPRRRAELCAYAHRLEQSGHHVTSRWLGETNPPIFDLSDILSSELILHFIGGDTALEFGFVLGVNLALSMSQVPAIRQYLIGDAGRHDFYMFSDGDFPDFNAFLVTLHNVN